MADNSTFITGVADGAFEDAFGDLPQWASEETLKKIEDILSETLDRQTKAFSVFMKSMQTAKSSGSGSDEDVRKSLDALLKEFDEATTKQKKRTKLDDEEDKKVKKRRNEVQTSSDAFNAIIGAMGENIKKAFVENTETFDQLYASGIDLVSGFDSAKTGFESLQQLSTITGVRFTELAKSIEKYSTAVNSFGLGKFAKTSAGAAAKLQQFGYTASQSADLLGAFLESQQGYMDVNSKTQQQVTKDLLKFGERVTNLSQAFGVSRQKLLENIDAISQSVEANILSGQVGTDAAQSTLDFVASFKDQKLGQAFLRMMTDSIKPLNDTFMDFQKTGFGGFGQKLLAFTQSLESVTDPQEKARMTAEFAKANDQEMKIMIQRGTLLRQAGVKEAEGMLQTVVGLRQVGNTYKEVSKEERDKMNATAQSTAAIKTEWERLMSQMQQAFAPTVPLFLKLAGALVWLNTKIEQFTQLFDSTTRSWVGVGIMALSFGLALKKAYNIFSKLSGGLSRVSGTMGEVFGSIGRIFSSFAPLLARVVGVVGALVAAFEVGFAIGTALYEVLSKFDWFNNAMDTIFDTFGKVSDWLADAAISLVSGFNKGMSFVSDIFTSLGSWISDKTSGLVDYIVSIFGKPISVISGVFSQFSNAFISGNKLLVGAFGSVLDWIKSKFSWIPGLGSSDTSSPSSNTPIPSPALPSAPSAAPLSTSTPKASTLNSPSQVSTKPEEENKSQAPVKEPSKPNGSGIEKPATGSDINNALGYQTSLLEQLVQSTNSLVSVNKDILKYTRVHT